MKVTRNPRYLIAIADNITDAHIWAAITPPRAWVDQQQDCAEGVVYRVFGYTIPVPEAGRTIRGEDLYGPVIEFLLGVQNLVPVDAPDEAQIIYAFEADERGFWEHGGTS